MLGVSFFIVGEGLFLWIAYEIGRLKGWFQGSNYSREAYRKIIDMQSSGLEAYKIILTDWKKMYLELYAKTTKK